MRTYQTRIPDIGEDTWEEGGQTIAPSPEAAAVEIAQCLEDSGDLSVMTSQSHLRVWVREVGIVRPVVRHVDVEKEDQRWRLCV